jgi:hypothetical protein
MTHSKYAALNNVTRWIQESSFEDFLEKFNKIEGKFTGITIGEYLEECRISLEELHEVDHGYRNIMTTLDFVFGLEELSESQDVSTEVYVSNKFKSFSCELVSLQSRRAILINGTSTEFFEVKNGSTYFLEAYAA